MTSRRYKPKRKTKGEEKNVVEVSHAVSEAVKLCEPDVMAIYPITPQSI